MTTNIVITPASEADAPLILATVLQAFKSLEGVINPPSSVFKETQESILAKLRLGGVYLAYKESQVVGCVLYEIQDKSVYLGRLSVIPEYRQQGIATQLVHAVEQKAIDLEKSQINLYVRIQLIQNQNFFKSLGFRRIAEHTHEGFSNPTYISMMKDLERR